MANQYAMLASGGAISFAASTTYFLSFNAGQWTNTTENRAQAKFRGASTIDQWYVNVITATTGATTADIRQNTASSAVTVSCTGTATGTFSDLTHSVTVADGDLIDYRFVCGATGSFVANVSSRLSTTGQVYTELTGANQLLSTSSTTFASFAGAGIISPVSVEQDTEIVALESATFSHLQVFLYINSISGSHSVKFRKNEATGVQTVAITASTTGFYEDTTNSDTLAAGDRAATIPA